MRGRVHPVVVCMLLGILAFFFFQASDPPEGFPPSAWKILGVAVLMLVLWITEWVPFAITAMLPLLLFPAMGVFSLKQSAVHYANPVIFLFLGGFLIGLSLESSGLHKRIAFQIIRLTGRSYKGVLFGFWLSTFLITMWISNTATMVMMTAIALPAVGWLFDSEAQTELRDRFKAILLLGIAYASSIGGVSTLIGTPPNAVMAGFMSEIQGIEVGFLEWMIYAVPVAVFLFMVMYIYLARALGARDSDAEKKLIRERMDQHLQVKPQWSPAEKVVAFSFSLAVFLWFFRGPVNELIGRDLLDDTSIALLGGMLPFFVPLSLGKPSFAIRWEATRDLPWSILLLFGGGLCLASGLEDSGCTAWMGEKLTTYFGDSPVMMLFLLLVLMLVLTELMGNVALATIFLPLTFQVATITGVPPAYYAFSATLVCSFGFMLPISTPPNAIAYGQGNVPMKMMVRKGFWLNAIGLLFVFFYTLLYFGVLDG